MIPHGYEIAVILAMLALNAFLAAFEMALASISKGRLQVLANHKRNGAASALYMKERFEATLAVIQVGITVAGAVAAATGGAGVQEALTPMLKDVWGLSHGAARAIAVLVIVVPLSGFTIIFGELVPKVFAVENKEWVCLGLAPFMRVFSILLWPIAFLFESSVKGFLKWERKIFKGKTRESGDTHGLHELEAAAFLARSQHLMGAHQEKIVLAASQLSRRPIRDIVLPASEISTVPATLSLSEGLLKAHMDLHTRFPIAEVENDPQTIEGYITFKDLVSALKMHAATPTVKGIARPIKRLQGDTTISLVLEQMMREKLHIALVVDNKDKVLGLVTLEDIMEELVGDIESEEDSLPIHTHPTSGGWIMGGGVPISAVASRLGVAWSPSFSGPVNLRLADWCVQVLGRPLEKGETVRAEGLQISVRKLRRHKLAEAFISKIATA